MDQNASKSKPQNSASYAWLAWILCGIVSLTALANLVQVLLNRPADNNLIKLASQVAYTLFPIVFTVVAALIISRQPRNSIGWLLLPPALVAIGPIDRYIEGLTVAPTPTIPLLLMLWFQNWSWLLLIFPILLILLLFPTGRPPSPRWRWVLYYALGMAIFLVSMTTFGKNMQPLNGGWSVPNPIGFIPDDPAILQPVILLWVISLGLLTILCAISLFVRYRRAQAVEREQIKWLLYAGGVFVLFYVPALLLRGNGSQWVVTDISDLLLPLLVSLFPIAIAFAILRYRLWEIDVLIRKTLVYAVLTAALALVFFISVVLLQQVFGGITGTENSPVVIVLSTLAIAALFSPLRRRIQAFIDRRFYRKKYDAEQILAGFAANVRDEVEIEQLTAHLLSVVKETVQPESVSLWLKAGWDLAKRNDRGG